MPLIPAPGSITANVIANVIVSAGTWALKSSYDLAELPTGDLKDPSEVMARAVAKALDPLLQVDQVAPELGGERFRLLLESPDLFNFVQRLFLAEFYGRTEQEPQMEAELFALWSAWVGIAESSLRPHCTRIFAAVREAVRGAASEARACGMEPPGKSRHDLALIARQLAAIDRRLSFLQGGHSIERFQEFERQYRKQLQERFSRLTPHIDDARRVPLDEIYVEPMFSQRRGSTWSDDRLSFADLRAQLLRSVVVGQPGGGKSTLVSKLCFDLTRYYDERFVGGVSLCPVPVVLRDYGVAKAERQLSILDFAEELSKTSLQLDPPPGAFEYMMQQGRALVIFDGLDELVDPSRRRGIRDDIESFCVRFPAIRVLVTAREIGYEQAPLDPDEFTRFQLAEFNDEQVGAYIHRWFGAHPDLAAQQVERQAEAFLRESEMAVSDLRRNPLLLALMCNIYKGEGYIPTNRPEVYEKCSNMLLRRWDASRGIDMARPLGAHLERTLEYLAHWVCTHVDLQSGVGERRLVDVAAEFLTVKKFDDDPDEARLEAQNFLEFCKGRAWVLVEVGSSTREPLFQFAHRTFLEYFTAKYLVRTAESVAALGNFLLDKMGPAAWDMVAQLAFQIQHSHNDAGDELLELTLRSAEESDGPARMARLSFAARTLQFLVPTPGVARKVAQAALAAALSGIAEVVEAGPGRPLASERNPGPVAVFVLGDLGEAADDNIRTIRKSVERQLADAVGSEKSHMALAGATLVLALSQGAFYRGQGGYLERIAREVLSERLDRVFELADSDATIANSLLLRGEISLARFVEECGVECLFAPPRSYLEDLVIDTSWAQLALYRVSRRVPVRDPSTLEPEFDEVGRLLMRAETPWVRSGATLSRAFFFFGRRLGVNEGVSAWSHNALFGVFCLALPYVQTGMMRDQVTMSLRHLPIEQAQTAFASLFRARLDGYDETDVEAALESLEWSDEQRTFARRWARRRFSTIGREAAPWARPGAARRR